MNASLADTVARVVWPWRDRVGAGAAALQKKDRPSAAPIIQTLVGAVVAGLFLWRHHYLMAGIVAATAGLLAVCSLVWLAGYHAVQRGFEFLGVWLARLTTYVLLVPCFILVFAVAHLFLFLLRRDPLGARFVRGSATYWTKRAPVSDYERHLENQY